MIFVKNNFRSFPYFEIMLDGTEANLELKKTERYSFTLYTIYSLFHAHHSMITINQSKIVLKHEWSLCKHVYSYIIYCIRAQ